VVARREPPTTTPPAPSTVAPAPSRRNSAPAKSTSEPSAADAPPAPAGKARPALGAYARNEPAAPAPRAAAPDTESDTNDVATGALDFDDVIVAWSHTLESLNNVARAMVQAAVPIGLDGDTVVFGVPKTQLVAVQTPFRNNADEIRSVLAQHLGRRVKFKLAEHDFDAPGALQPRIMPSPTAITAAAPTSPLAPGAAAAATVLSNEVPPPEEPPDDLDVIDLADIVDARDAPPLRDTTQLFMSELGAQVVEERPFGQ
jgi:hypothetical protein